MEAIPDGASRKRRSMLRFLFTSAATNESNVDSTPTSVCTTRKGPSLGCARTTCKRRGPLRIIGVHGGEGPRKITACLSLGLKFVNPDLTYSDGLDRNECVVITWLVVRNR